MRQRRCEGGEWKGGQHALVHPHFLCMKGRRQQKGEGMGGRLTLACLLSACSWGGSQCGEGERVERGAQGKWGRTRVCYPPSSPPPHPPRLRGKQVHKGMQPPAPPLAAPRRTHRRSAREGMLPPLVAPSPSSSSLAAPPVHAERGHASTACRPQSHPSLFARKGGAQWHTTTLSLPSPLVRVTLFEQKGSVRGQAAPPPLSCYPQPLPFPSFVQKGCTRTPHPSPIPVPPCSRRRGRTRACRSPEGATVPFPRSLFVQKGAHKGKPSPPHHMSHRRARGLPYNLEKIDVA
ncbi:hypothetical protein EDB86DRAFT_2835365 [Lactarius hatsudake]|nr:hypothetical protein EDB86DRAFT_2835365 [Lactarius hatsudake]